jgi:hypothetical protein
MIIGEFYIKGIAVHEPETNAPLIMNCNQKLTSSLPLQFVKPVARRHLQIFKPGCQVHIFELPFRPSRDVWRKSLRYPFTYKSRVSWSANVLITDNVVICHVTIVNDFAKARELPVTAENRARQSAQRFELFLIQSDLGHEAASRSEKRKFVSGVPNAGNSCCRRTTSHA